VKEAFFSKSRIIPRLALSHRARQVLLSLAVLALALLPRLVNLGAFITADEDDQIMFASHFLKSMLKGNFGGALVLGYPGVPTLILGAAGVAARYLAHYSGLYPLPWVTAGFWATLSKTTAQFGMFEHPLDFLVWVRAPLAVTAALAVWGIYLLTRRLINPPVALIAAVVLAFDPFILAHSRVIHVDAPQAYFMFLSFLAFMLYLEQGGWRWLLLSGLFGGLAGLSKTPAVLLGPILALAGLMYALLPPPDLPRRVRWQRLALALTGWGLIAVAAIFALWPSMWSRPQYALQWVVNNVYSVSSGEHPTSGVFWNAWQSDQNPLYYLLVFPFHLTPLTTVGCVAGLALIGVGLAQRRRQNFTGWPAQMLPLALGLVGYVVVYITPISLVARRGDRYILPVYFAVGLLSALAVWWLAQWAAARLARFKLAPGWLAGGALLAQTAAVLVYQPYYLAYFNPLVGGPWLAPQYINIGWGEGLDQAAAYLNAAGGPEKTPVAAWYSNQFAPYYHGPTIDLSSEQAALTAPATVFYINQVQRGFPNKEILNYFRQRQPEKVIELGGVEYAWIYPGPVIGREPQTDFTFPLAAVLGGKARLYGVKVGATGFSADEYAAAPHENDLAGPYPGYKETIKGLPVTLFWETLGAINSNQGKLNVFIRLVDDRGNIWGQVDRLILSGLWRANRWLPGYYLRDEYKLPLDWATPPGRYQLEVGLYDFETGHNYGVVKNIGQITLSPPQTLPAADRLNVENSQPHPFDKSLRAVGHTFAAAHLPPGGEIAGKVFWQAAQKIDNSYQLQFFFVGPDQKRYVINEGLPLAQTYTEPQWRPAEIVGQAYRFRIPAVAPPGVYPMQLAVVNLATGQFVGEPLTLATVTVEAHERNFTLPADVAPTSAVINNEIELIGYKLDNPTVQPGQTFGLTLYWRSLEFAAAGYTVFVHVVGPDNSIRGQWDSVPAQGKSPTTGWVPGEIIADHFDVPLAADAPPWKYDIFVGMYDPVTGQRQPLFSPAAPASDNRVWLTRVQVVTNP